MPRPASLSLATPKSSSAVSSTVTSPTDAGSAMSSPASAHANPVPSGGSARHHKASKSIAATFPEPQSSEIKPHSPEITSLPPFPSSPKNSTRHPRESSRGFFSNIKASKSSNRVHHVEPTIRQVSEDLPRSQVDSQQASIYSLRKGPGSTPDLSLSSFDVSSTDGGQGKYIQSALVKDLDYAHCLSGRPPKRKEVPIRPAAPSVGSDSAIMPAPTGFSYPRKSKPRFSNLLSRTRSVRADDGGREFKPSTPITTFEPVRRIQYDGNNENEDSRGVPRTAPLNPDRSLREMMASGVRNHSADRQSSNHSSENVVHRRMGPSSSSSNSNSGLSTSTSGIFREGTGSHLFANIKQTSTKAADGLGRAGKGILGKMNRSGSSTAERDERYVLRIINLPLVEQTRRTRIAARLEDSKDKTEFWMPALPWRCIEWVPLEYIPLSNLC